MANIMGIYNVRLSANASKGDMHMWGYLEVLGRSVWRSAQLVYIYTTNIFHFGVNPMHRHPTICFAICTIVSYWDLAYFGYFLPCKIANKYCWLYNTCLWCFPESYDSLLCVFNCWLGAFLIPATAGVESEPQINATTRHPYEPRTHHHTPAWLGYRYKVSNYHLVATYAQKEWHKPLFLHFFDFLLMQVLHP